MIYCGIKLKASDHDKLAMALGEERKEIEQELIIEYGLHKIAAGIDVNTGHFYIRIKNAAKKILLLSVHEYLGLAIRYMRVTGMNLRYIGVTEKGELFMSEYKPKWINNHWQWGVKTVPDENLIILPLHIIRPALGVIPEPLREIMMGGEVEEKLREIRNLKRKV